MLTEHSLGARGCGAFTAIRGLYVTSILFRNDYAKALLIENELHKLEERGSWKVSSDVRSPVKQKNIYDRVKNESVRRAAKIRISPFLSHSKQPSLKS